ncbi:MAG TPA: zinc ABC transporter permease, partial [Planctomycetaceae bacterium]|nr:zinc ABC transporter permease [Planctomycetaceae bacterium]
QLQDIHEIAGDDFRHSSLGQLSKVGLIDVDRESRYSLTDKGRAAAERIVRGHRLWESFLDTEFQLPEDHLHDAAHLMEHYLDQESREQIERDLGSPEADPHGRSIPPQDSN